MVQFTNQNGFNMVNQITPDLQVRSLPYRALRQLAELLDIPGPHDWKSLISELPSGAYTRGQIARFEKENYRPGGSAAMALLTDFGHQLMTVGELAAYLELIDHQEALLIVKPHEPVTITKQPSPVIVQESQDTCISCEATGFPRPRYQWYKYQNPLTGKCTPVLKFKDVTIDASGDYYCKITNPIGSEYTEVVNVQVTPLIAPIINGTTGPEDVYARTFSGMKIQDPNGFPEETVIMYVGQYFVLSCDTDAQSYQWYKNSYPIASATNRNLLFNEFQLADEGHYSCKVNVNGKEIVTRLAHLKIGNPPLPMPPPNNKLVNQEFATAKLALVIANQKYQFPRNESEILVHPIDDAKLLSATLEKIGFKVTCLVNLTKKEMEAAIQGFCKLLECTKGVYSLFYFCGHGFEDHGKTFLVPIDATNKWTSDVALSAEYVLSEIQHCRATKLDVVLLDVCRIKSGGDQMSDGLRAFDPPFLAGAQCVFGYATCPQSQAFEKRRDTNGIYMKHLARHLTENIEIEKLLHKVGIAVREEAERHRITNTMSPTYKSTTTKVFSLCDNILPPAGFLDERDPTIEWFDYHRLPSSQSISFEHGVEIEMRFLPVCSNICNVVIHVASMGETTCCDAKILEVCEDLEAPFDSMNREISVLPEYFSKSLPFDSKETSMESERPSGIERWTQVSGLQKLTGPFAVTMKIEYIHGDPHEIKHSFKKQIFRNDEFGIVSFFNTF